ncbi:MAG TPA: outer membrane beta-barrel protein [Steroidobacteraceae bacterium]|nr:outer membrane beta-barrel protein [Steroidobacteraceae bacterium]
MKTLPYGLFATLLTGLSSLASAQSYGYSDRYTYAQRPIQWHIMGGYAPTTGTTSDYLDGGWSIGGGLTFRPDPVAPLSLRADVSFSRFDATNNLLNLGSEQNQTRIDDGWGNVVSLDVDAVFDVPLGPRARGYVMAGIGGAYRRIDLTQTVGFDGYFCDPWYGFCGAGIVAGDVLVQRTETTRFAWNAGAGIEFPLYNGQSWFIEARFERMETPTPTEFVPIRVGLRF